jgi:hypothetical protein
VTPEVAYAMPELKVRNEAQIKNDRNRAECEVVENLGSGIRGKDSSSEVSFTVRE